MAPKDVGARSQAAEGIVVEPLFRLFDDGEWMPIRRALGLSPRESDIVLRALAGEKESVIAIRLGISSHTVHSHVTRIYRKLSVSSRAELFVRLFAVHLMLARRAH